MSEPWLSVILPTYNGERYVRRALDSIAIQHDPGIEIIAIDDGSTDSTRAILRDYQSRLPLTILERRVGDWAANSNLGLERATGRHACFLHQDDAWRPGRLAAIRRQLSLTPDVTLLLHACEFIDEHDRPLGPWRCPYPGYKPLPPSFSMERLLVQNFIGMPAPTFPRQLALDLGGLDASLWYTADWDLWLKLAAAGETLSMPRTYGCFRLHPQSQTASRSHTLDDFRRQMEIIHERHAPRWPARCGAVRASVLNAAWASVAINTALAARYHGQPVPWGRLLQLWSVNPHRLLRDSRLWERSSARLRAGFTQRK